MIENIDNIRNDILNIAIESNKYEEIEDKIYLAIEYLYKALNLAHIEKNKDIEPVAFERFKLLGRWKYIMEVKYTSL